LNYLFDDREVLSFLKLDLLFLLWFPLWDLWFCFLLFLIILSVWLNNSCLENSSLVHPFGGMDLTRDFYSLTSLDDSGNNWLFLNTIKLPFCAGHWEGLFDCLRVFIHYIMSLACSHMFTPSGFSEMVFLAVDGFIWNFLMLFG
jgi:hypothetical protein